MLDKKPKLSCLKTKQPLIISSSGGSGHISCTQNIIQNLLQDPNSRITYHYWQKPSQKCLSFETLVRFALSLMNVKPIKYFLEKSLKVVIPNKKDIILERNALIQQQMQQPRRQYVDFILDILPNGYIFTAIFNFMQKIGHAKTLQIIVKNQGFLDFIYQSNTQHKIYHLLETALQNRQPYDAIISTQALGIPGICAAVRQYNQQIPHFESMYDCLVPKLEIQQFITDIPHISAKHFLVPLERLNPLDKTCIKLHLLDIEAHNHFNVETHANEVVRYQPKTNPMIRDDFKKDVHHPCYGIHVIHANEYIITLTPKQRLAVIMLSSGNGEIALDYIEALIQMRIEHIALVGQANEVLTQALQKLNHPSVYTLGHLNGQQISHLLTYTQILIIKGGGLSLMEISSFELPKDSIIFIHKPIDLDTQLQTSGLVWEDGNTDWFLQYCEKNLRKALVTHPSLIRKQYLQHGNFLSFV